MNRFFQLFRVCSALVSLGAFSLAQAIPGQPGTLDATWATTSPLGAGKLITPVGAGDDTATAALWQPDGKIVLTGYCPNGSSYDFCTVRYLATGALDTGFGNAATPGKLITPVGTGNDFAIAALLQPDGKIVLAGFCFNGSNDDFCAVRYLPTGALDPSFGDAATPGKLMTAVGAGNDSAYAALLQPDGKIVLAGYCFNGSNNDFCAVRYLPTGALDTSFGNAATPGKLMTAVGTSDDYANAALLQADGKIVLAGQCSNGSNSDFCAARYLPTGALDTSFGSAATPGRLHIPVGTGNDVANAALLQPDGKIVLAGRCSNGSNSDFCAVRYSSTGALDPSFGDAATPGKSITPVGTGNDYANAALLQPDGKIVLAGYCSNGSNNDFCAARYLSTGALDTSFGDAATPGKLITPVGTGFDVAYAALLQPDGKIVLAGACSSGTNKHFCSVRYDGGPNTPKTLTEYIYNPLNYYFLTSRDTEKATLDALPGWARTGQSFSTRSFADPGALGISRYYFDQIANNQTRGSHFYTLVNSEKTALSELNPNNLSVSRLPVNEGIDSYAFAPVIEGVGGSCAAGQTPVYRLFRGQVRFPDDPNHRFTTSLALYNQFVALGWDGEGVKLCAPN